VPGRSDDRGTATLLILGFATVLLGLIVVVVDVSAVLLSRRALVALADTAALAAAQELDEAAYYEGDAADAVPIDADAAERAVRVHTEAARRPDRPPPIVDDVRVADDGVTVTVSMRQRVRLPLIGGVVDAGEPVVRATVAARSPIAGVAVP
jgi:Flp pilus assembly protein TadG